MHKKNISRDYMKLASRRLILLTGVGLFLIATLIVTIGPARQDSSAKQPEAREKQAVIQITAEGFVPQTLIVKPGTRILWRNSDNAPHAVIGNFHTSNKDNPELRSETIAPGASYTYLATKEGNITYRDDLMPTHNGTITVKE